ncbi:MAG: FAD-binding protein [Peptococcaceae bacterium]|nr:FAD-binding protein [Peptococcaceae bacterium]
MVTVIETDVVVVGGGLAGVSAARQAAESGVRVVLLDKARAGTSGTAAFSAGEMLCWIPGRDSLEDWVQAYLEAGEGLNSRAWLTMFFEGQYRIVERLASQGFPFLTDASGNFARRSGRGPLVRCVLAPMMTFQEKNRQACASLGVKILDRFCAVEVLMHRGEPAGVAGFGVRDGEVAAVLAPSVIISTGGCSYRGPFFGQDAVAGEGMAMALGAGARLAYMEYGNNYDVSLARFDTCGESRLTIHGGRYLNGLGQAFLEKEGFQDHRVSGNELARAMVEEVRAGRGCIYIDLSGFKERRLADELTPNLKMALDRGGVNLFADRQEVIPAFTGASNASPAGIWIDRKARTSVAGIFAAGDCACKGLVTGACVGITGVSLAWANYTGHLAGKSAAAYAAEAGGQQARFEAEDLAGRLVYPLGRNLGRRPGEILRDLGEEMARVDVSLIRSGARLVDTLGRVSTWRWELENLSGAKDLHDLMIWYEARSALTVAEATLLAAVERRESRGGHYREDYPSMNPEFQYVLGVEEINGVKCVRPVGEVGVTGGGGGRN